MEKNIKKILYITISVMCLILIFTLNAKADTSSELSDTTNKIDDLEEQKSSEETELENQKNYQSGLTGDLASLNDELDSISNSLDELQTQIQGKNDEIEEKQTEIEAMQAKADKQYKAMKKRIQYMYEHGTQSVLATFLSADNFSDFLNQTEYIIAIQDYDRNKLNEYQDTQKQIVADKEELEDSKQELVVMQEKMQEKQDSVDSLIGEKQEKIKEANAAITETQETIDEYEQQIASQKAYEEQLEKQKAEEDAKHLEEIKKREAETPTSIVTNTSEGDQTLLAALIECEAGGESYEGMLAVGSVVMNRVASSYYPNTVVGVIYESGQFSPVASGRFAMVLASGASGVSASSSQAAAAVLAGTRTVTCLYFRTNNNIIEGTVIGNHVFY